MKKIQQGDVILRLISNLDKESGKELKHLILAEGKVSGHKHQIVSGIATLIMIQDKMFLKVLSDYAKLKHNTHDEITIPKGDYSVSIVREKDPFEEKIRRVAD